MSEERERERLRACISPALREPPLPLFAFDRARVRKRRDQKPVSVFFFHRLLRGPPRVPSPCATPYQVSQEVSSFLIDGSSGGGRAKWGGGTAPALPGGMIKKHCSHALRARARALPILHQSDSVYMKRDCGVGTGRAKPSRQSDGEGTDSQRGKELRRKKKRCPCLRCEMERAPPLPRPAVASWSLSKTAWWREEGEHWGDTQRAGGPTCRPHVCINPPSSPPRALSQASSPPH